MEQLYTASVVLNKETFKKVMEETMEISPGQKKKIKWRRLVYLIAAISMGGLAYFGFSRYAESWFYIFEGIVSGIFDGLFFNTCLVF